MKKIVRLTESDLVRIVKRVIMEQLKFRKEEGMLDDEIMVGQLDEFMREYNYERPYQVNGHKLEKYVEDGGAIYERGPKTIIYSLRNGSGYVFQNGKLIQGNLKFEDILKYIP